MALTITITDASYDPDGAIVSWHYDFGDGNTSTQRSPTHVYAAPGNYTVTQTVTDDKGATFIRTKVVAAIGGTAKLIEIWGQSTAVGRGNVNTLVATAVPPWTAAFNGVTLKQAEYTPADPPVLVYDDIRTLQPRTWNSATVNMGIELSLGRFLYNIDPTFSGIIKYGLGSIGLDQGFKPLATYPTAPPHLDTRIYAYFLVGDAALTGVCAAGLFLGCETDALTSGPANAVQANLQAVLAAFRAVHTPTTPFGILRLTSALPIGIYPFRDVVIAAENAFVAANAGNHVFMFTADDLAIDSGNHEYVGDSLITIGQRAGLAICGALGIDIAPVTNWSVGTAADVATFTDLSTDIDGTITAWHWDFGDGNTSTAQNPSHTYAADGTYTVVLTVTDNGGAQNAHSAPVTVATPTWYVDSGSGFGMPKSPADWAAAIAALANGTPLPTHAVVLDIASGNPVCMFTGKVFVVSGGPLYHQTIAPWTALGMGPNGTAVNQIISNATMLNVNAAPSWLFGYIACNVTAQNRQQMGHGGADNNSFEAAAGTAKMRYRIGGAAKNSTLDHYDGSIRPIHLVYNPGVEASGYSNIEKVQLTPQPITAASGVTISLQLGISTDAASAVRALMFAHWDGFVPTNAQVKSMNQLFSWPVSGY